MNRPAGRSQGLSQGRKVGLILVGLAVVLLLGAGEVAQFLQNRREPASANLAATSTSQPTASATPKLSAPYLLSLNAPIQSVVWAPDGTAVLAGNSAGYVGLWEVR